MKWTLKYEDFQAYVLLFFEHRFMHNEYQTCWQKWEICRVNWDVKTCYMVHHYALKSCEKIHELICQDFNTFKFRWRSKCSCRKFPMLPKHLWGKRYAVVTRNLERFDFGKQCWLMGSSTARNQYCIWLQKPIDWVNNPPSLFSHCVCLCVCV